METKGGIDRAQDVNSLVGGGADLTGAGGDLAGREGLKSGGEGASTGIGVVHGATDLASGLKSGDKGQAGAGALELMKSGTDIVHAMKPNLGAKHIHLKIPSLDDAKASKLGKAGSIGGMVSTVVGMASTLIDEFGIDAVRTFIEHLLEFPGDTAVWIGNEMEGLADRIKEDLRRRFKAESDKSVFDKVLGAMTNPLGTLLEGLDLASEGAAYALVESIAAVIKSIGEGLLYVVHAFEKLLAKLGSPDNLRATATSLTEVVGSAASASGHDVDGLKATSSWSASTASAQYAKAASVEPANLDGVPGYASGLAKALNELADAIKEVYVKFIAIVGDVVGVAADVASMVAELAATEGLAIIEVISQSLGVAKGILDTVNDVRDVRSELGTVSGSAGALGTQAPDWKMA